MIVIFVTITMSSIHSIIVYNFMFETTKIKIKSRYIHDVIYLIWGVFGLCSITNYAWYLFLLVGFDVLYAGELRRGKDLIK